MYGKISGYEEKLLRAVEYSKDDSLSKNIDQLCTKLLNFSDLFLLQAYKINIAFKASENMKELIENAEKELKELQVEATEIQKNTKIYVADEDDNIDKAVANTLKDLGRPLGFGIVRISNGNYLCRDKKIKISFAGNKLQVLCNGASVDFLEYLSKA